jgi:hypothetical protein
MTVIPNLETELLRAAERVSTAASAPRRAQRLGSLMGRWVPVAFAVIVAITVGVIALASLHTRPGTPSQQVASPRGREQLIDLLAVLRRPQTKADVAFSALKTLENNRGKDSAPVDVPLVRYAMTSAWGERLYIVPFKPLTAAQRQAILAQSPRVPASILNNIAPRGETVGLLGSHSPGRLDITIDEILTGTGLLTEHLPATATRRSPEERVLQIVPDGVARVRVRIAERDAKAKTLWVRYLTASVHNNVLAIQRTVKRGLVAISETWYAANRRIIRRIQPD